MVNQVAASLNSLSETAVFASFADFQAAVMARVDAPGFKCASCITAYLEFVYEQLSDPQSPCKLDSESAECQTLGLVAGTALQQCILTGVVVGSSTAPSGTLSAAFIAATWLIHASSW